VTVDKPTPPPHEREWRHPAEISAEHRIVFAAEPPSRRLRAAAVISSALACIGIGLAAWLVATGSTGPEVGISSRSAQRPMVVAVPVDAAAGVAVLTWRGMARADGADGEADGVASVSLLDGTRIEVRHRSSVGDLVVVSIDGDNTEPFTAIAPLNDTAMSIVGNHPDSLSKRLVDVESFAELSSAPASIVDGTPVLDTDGHLIGLCSPHADGVDLILIDEAVLAALRAG